MAALRYAARKLLLQRTQASVVSSPTVERRLVPRLIHTGSSSSGAPNSCLTKDKLPKIHTGLPVSSSASGAPNYDTAKDKLPKIHTGLPVSSSASGAPNYDTAKILKIQEEVKKKKQELYDMLAVVERDRCYMRTGRAFLCRVRNLKLLQNLSVDVSPKPFDLKWHIYRKTRILNVWAVYLASIVVGLELGYLLKENEDDDTKIPLVNV